MALTYSDTVNYRGVLYLYGKSKAPFLNAIAPRTARCYSRTFPIAQPWTLSAASQDTQAETTAAAAGTPTTVTRGQDTNAIQIMKYDVQTTFMAESLAGSFSGVNDLTGAPVLSMLDFQKKAGLMQMASNMEYSLLQGAYTAESATSTNVKTRGLGEAVSTNTVAAGGLKLSKEMIEELVREMVDSGAPFDNVAIVANTFNIQMLSDIYGYAPMDRTLGGVAINEFLVPGAGTNTPIKVIYSPQQSTSVVHLVELSVCRPVFLPVAYPADGNVEPQSVMENGVDVMFVPSSVVNGAARGGFLYTQFGFDYGPEEYHGEITGLATSA
jgi:hypothetical protein